MATILEAYKEIASFIGAKFNDQGVLTQSYDGDPVAITVGGKVVHLPDTAFLRAPDWDNNIAFHPLSEQTFRGESEVLQQMRKLLVFRFNHTLTRMAECLMELAADSTQHRKLGAKASSYLSLIPQADQTSVQQLSAILDKVGSSNQRWLVGMYLKRPGKIGDKQYSRVGVMRYPILTEVNDSARTIFDVKLRVQDYESFKAFFRFLLGIPADGNFEVHNVGTNTDTAPYLTAMLGTGLAFAKHLNVLLKMFQKAIPEFGDLMFDTGWEVILEQFDKLATALPPLEGNRGVPNPESEQSDPEAEAVPGGKRRKGDRSAMLQNGLRDNIVIDKENPPSATTGHVGFGSVPNYPAEPTPISAPAAAQPAQPAQQRAAKEEPTETASWGDYMKKQQMLTFPQQQPMMAQYPQQQMVYPQQMGGVPMFQQPQNNGFLRQQPQMMQPQMMPQYQQPMMMTPYGVPMQPQQQQPNPVLSAFAQAGGMGVPQQQPMMNQFAAMGYMQPGMPQQQMMPMYQQQMPMGFPGGV